MILINTPSLTRRKTTLLECYRFLLALLEAVDSDAPLQDEAARAVGSDWAASGTEKRCLGAVINFTIHTLPGGESLSINENKSQLLETNTTKSDIHTKKQGAKK